eukprot:CAMPEP_0203919332 /NCGR_PEP_ID=MMETSP0359-20131031/59777_1 /ASSEMBLY_ACC=CAM_ASM_000338 /TAXON_ID=268821 /ORGANISM="Scrippsiella Hangoei, Strain SHTV-5" /LENGTH=221 /DNA_ID=CAMNT_0050846613 /DNA_START=8 /DNA_END=671 /DNA_ORIENTATION=+
MSLPRASAEAQRAAANTGYIVDPETRRAYQKNHELVPLSDVLSDNEAPPRSFVTFRGGKQEYVSEDVLTGKVVALFFGANGPFCCGFARNFAKVYRVVKREESDPFEVVYVGADKSRREFNRFVKTMPWLALPFRDNTAVFERYGVPMEVGYWPRMVIINPNDRIIFEDAVPVAKQCFQEKKPEAFGSLLASAWSDSISFGRFQALFGLGDSDGHPQHLYD